jgi:hypothetical protein
MSSLCLHDECDVGRTKHIMAKIVGNATVLTSLEVAAVLWCVSSLLQMCLYFIVRVQSYYSIIQYPHKVFEFAGKSLHVVIAVILVGTSFRVMREAWGSRSTSRSTFAWLMAAVGCAIVLHVLGTGLQM